MIDDNHLFIMIADVSGKGVPAALFMVAAITNLRNYTSALKNPDDLKIVDEKLSTEEILSEVRKSLEKFSVNAEQSDDITMIAIKFEGRK